ncbi:MAG: dihydroneopterin aldolase [Bacteroidales bacterium]|nr:dihydroneopterin aldolase [Bacteroidales bacterium]
MQQIEIKGLELYAYHGVIPSERRVGNLFSLDITLSCDLSAAMTSDDVADTINYAAVVETARLVMSQPSNLLEHVAARLRDAIMLEFPAVKGGYIRIAKLHPPISARLSSVAVAISW